MARYDTNQYREARLGESSASLLPFKVVDSDGEKVTFASETVTATCYDPDGSEISGVLTAAVRTGTALVDFTLDTSGSSFSLDEFYRVDFSVTVSGETYQHTFYFDVVKRTFDLTLSDDDYPPELDVARNESSWGRITQLAKTLLVADLRRKKIMQYDAAGTEEVADALGYTGQSIKPIRIGLIRNPSVLYPALRCKALQLAYLEATGAAGDHWFMLAEKCGEEYEREFASAVGALLYDGDEDLKIEDGEDAAGGTWVIR